MQGERIMPRNRAVAIIASCVLLALACGLATPAPEPTATWTPIPPFPTGTATTMPTPVVVVVTATPEPTPTMGLHDLVMIPQELRRFAAQLVPVCGDDFTYAPRLGLTRDTVVYLLYETPAGSGQFYVASYGIQGDEWKLLDTTAVEEPTPTPQSGRRWPEGEALR